MPAVYGTRARRTCAGRARPEGRSGAAQRHAILHRARACMALFAIERVFQTALVTGALATDAARGSDTPFDPRIHALRGHRGQIDVAAALRALMTGSEIRASHLTGDDPHSGSILRALPAAGDGRGARSDAAGGGDADHRGKRRVGQSAGHRRYRRSHCPAAISTPNRSPSRPICWRWRSARSARWRSGASPC